MLSKSLILFALAVAPASSASPQLFGWRADLHLLASTIMAKHAAPFHHISRAQFNREVDALDRRLPSLDQDGFFVGLDTIVNSIGDGHTGMRLPADSPHFGVEFRRFDGTYRLIAADPDSAAVADLGLALIAVDGVPIAEVHRRLMSLTPADETQPLREVRAEALLDNGVVLHGLQLGARDTVRYTFKDDAGAAKTTKLPAVAEPNHDNWVRLPRQPAVSQMPSKESITCSHLPQNSALYCNFRSYSGLAQAGAGMMQMLHSSGANRLIVDMRENGGGNFCEGLKHVVEPIAADESINRPGRLFILIGARTFSAAMSNAVHFRELTSATLVGEPIGEKPNSYQEVDETTLPHTGWIVRYSTLFYRFGDGPENLVRPDVEVHVRWDDFRNGRDPVLAYALDHRNDGPVKARPKHSGPAAESQSCG